MSVKPGRDNAPRPIGVVEDCRNGILVGWAQVPRMALVPAVVDIEIDGTVVGSAKANVFRADLRDQGVRDGFAGFQFAIPPRLHDGKVHHVTVTERVSKTALAGIGVFKMEAAKDHIARGDLFLSSVALRSTVDSAAFAETLRTCKKLAILCAFTPDNDLLGFHHTLISSLQAAGFAVLLGQSYAGAHADAGQIKTPASQADAYLVKDNLGYDFGTWLACIVAARVHLGALDELLLVNDSVFGPFCTPRVLSEMIAGCEGDAVGMCDSYERNYHLQSFFLLFRKNVLQSRVFEEFANAYPYNNEKDAVIREGELALTPLLQRQGFRCAAVFPYERLVRRWLDRVGDYVAALKALPENGDEKTSGITHVLDIARRLRRGEPVNPAHVFWDVLIEMGCPFIKRELLFKNPMDTPLLFRAPELLCASGYPLALIREAARRYGASRVFF